MATKKKKEKEFDLGPEPAQPQPRSLSDELGAIMPMLGELGGMGSEQYIKSQKELTQYQYDFFKQHYPELAGMEREQQSAATAQVRSDALNWLGQYGGTLRQAERAANPEWAAAQDKTMQLLGQIGPGSLQQNATQWELNEAIRQAAQGGKKSQFTDVLDRMAMQELQLGGRLTPEQERMAQQSARGAYAARGQVMSNPAALAEVLQRDSMAQARLRERQGIAAGREQNEFARHQMALQRLGAAQGMDLSRMQNEQQFVLESGRLAYGESLAPQFLGMTSTGTPATTLMGFTQGVRTPDPSSVYSAGLNYGADLFNTNLNMQASMYNSYQNNSAALQAAQMQSQAQIQAAQAQAGAMGGGGGSGMGGALIGAGGAVIGGVLAAF